MSVPPERRGVAASPGIAIGPAYVLRRERLIIPEYRVPPDRVEAEVERLERALVLARADLESIRSGMQDAELLGPIFDAQFHLLEDPTLREQAVRDLRESQRNAEWAVQREGRRLRGMFEAIPDPYVRERSSDVQFVVRRVLRALLGREPEGLHNAPPA